MLGFHVPNPTQPPVVLVVLAASAGGDWLRVAEEQQRFMALREAVEAATVGPGPAGPV